MRREDHLLHLTLELIEFVAVSFLIKYSSLHDSHVVLRIALPDGFEHHDVKFVKSSGPQKLKARPIDVCLLVIRILSEEVDSGLGLLEDCHHFARVLHCCCVVDYPSAFLLVLVLLLMSLDLSKNIFKHGFAIEDDDARLLEVTGVGHDPSCVFLDHSNQLLVLLSDGIDRCYLCLGPADQS